MSWEPSISVVIPTRDRPELLARCLDAVWALDVGPEPEVIVVDDGGAAPLDLSGIEVVSTGGVGPAAARNAGAAAAGGELIAFLDDDCAPAPDWLALLLERAGAERDEPAAAGGRIANALRGDRGAIAAQAIVDAVYAHHDADPGRATFLASSNLLVPAARFRETGGFDESFPGAGGEDREWSRRWIESGGRLLWEPRALISHAHPLGVAGFARQQFGYGRGAWLERRARSSRGHGFRVEPSLTSGIFATAMREAAASRDLPRVGLLLLWQAANLAGFGWQALAAALGRR